MPRLILLSAVCLGVIVGPTVGAGDDRGPTVYTAPGDVTPWRRSDSTRLFRDRPGDDLRQGRMERRERALRYELDRLDSRVTAQPERAIPRRRLEQDLEASRRELRSLETETPNADAVPLLEQQLDRLERPTDLGQ